MQNQFNKNEKIHSSIKSKLKCRRQKWSWSCPLWSFVLSSSFHTFSSLSTRFDNFFSIDIVDITWWYCCFYYYSLVLSILLYIFCIFLCSYVWRDFLIRLFAVPFWGLWNSHYGYIYFLIWKRFWFWDLI